MILPSLVNLLKRDIASPYKNHEAKLGNTEDLMIVYS